MTVRPVACEPGAPTDPIDTAYEHDTQVLRVHLANLRHKIEPTPSLRRHIVTDPGVGYRFAD